LGLTRLKDDKDKHISDISTSIFESKNSNEQLSISVVARLIVSLA